MYGEIINVGFTKFSELPIKVATTESGEVIGLAFICLTCGSMVIDRGKHELFFHR